MKTMTDPKLLLKLHRQTQPQPEHILIAMLGLVLYRNLLKLRIVDPFFLQDITVNREREKLLELQQVSVESPSKQDRPHTTLKSETIHSGTSMSRSTPTDPLDLSGLAQPGSKSHSSSLDTLDELYGNLHTPNEFVKHLQIYIDNHRIQSYSQIGKEKYIPTGDSNQS